MNGSMNPFGIPTRRQILQTISSGFGYLAFSSLATLAAKQESKKRTGGPLAPKEPHFQPRAKRVIFLCMRGGPSHVDTFDYKPKLTADHGKRGKYGGTLLKSPWEFKQHGESGLWISSLFPELARQADELCLLRGMHTDQPVHPQALTQMHTGTAQFIRPSLGAWTLYGLGSENDSLPGFVSMNPPPGTAANYGSGFLPAVFQGTKLGRSIGRQAARFGRQPSVVPDARNSVWTKTQQRQQLDFVQQLNRQKLDREPSHDGVEGVIESFELAFRMQDALPEVLDWSNETQATKELYGIGRGPADRFGQQCLLARRVVEAGVRFVEVTHGNWDHHSNLTTVLPQRCSEIDKPIAGLLTDLKQRGLLEDTLVIWSGEFGRTPAAQNRDGRDHNNRGYSSWMAGGGVRGGFSFGGTDEHGYEALTGKCHIHDWHATILHLLGLDHKRLTYRYAGRDFRLTDVYGNVLTDILG